MCYILYVWSDFIAITSEQASASEVAVREYVNKKSDAPTVHNIELSLGKHKESTYNAVMVSQLNLYVVWSAIVVFCFWMMNEEKITENLNEKCIST